MEEWKETWDAFVECYLLVKDTRIPALIKAGLQVNVTFEENEAEEVLRFVGPGPYDV